MKLAMKDGQELEVYIWDQVDNKEVRGIVQLVHGSCEHAMRYDEFAKYLNVQGYLVIGNDHRGHGKSVSTDEDLGYFGETNGWDKMVDDLLMINEWIRVKYSSLPIFMLGHSMGSFLARHYAIKYGETLNGVILSGTAHNPTVVLKLGQLVSSVIKTLKGPKYRSKFINKLSYDSFNKPYKNPRTTHEWLTRDTHVIDEFLNDQTCGFIFTTTGFRDMFGGLLFITNQKNIDKMPKSLPTLFISGEDDPVGNNGKMVKSAYHAFVDAGIQHVELKLYPHMRHEILNELDKQVVYNDITSFINKHIQK